MKKKYIFFIIFILLTISFTTFSINANEIKKPALQILMRDILNSINKNITVFFFADNKHEIIYNFLGEIKTNNEKINIIEKNISSNKLYQIFNIMKINEDDWEFKKINLNNNVLYCLININNIKKYNYINQIIFFNDVFK
ncbi:MAG: hypothetical protein ACOCP8_06375 [archaeon]